MDERRPLDSLDPSTCIVVTSIASPNAVLRLIAGECIQRQLSFLVIGDVSSPADFELPGCEFASIQAQRRLDFACARLLPTRHYARKNLGYLLAMRKRAHLILETDDDNFPRPGFWRARHQSFAGPTLSAIGWANIYSYFSGSGIWPRGLPLDEIRQTLPAFESLPIAPANCPIQQGLADENPDVDAIYRLLFPLPQSFRADRRIALGPGAWCPFNSQNTAWFPDAYPLLYLPSYCSFRMTDIWRSFVAQRIAWTNGWSVLFAEADVYQERNDHSLMKDFADEVPGYLHNRRIAETLEQLNLPHGPAHIGANLVRCYEALAGLGLVDAKELPLVEAWLDDLKALGQL